MSSSGQTWTRCVLYLQQFHHLGLHHPCRRRAHHPHDGHFPLPCAGSAVAVPELMLDTAQASQPAWSSKVRIVLSVLLVHIELRKCTFCYINPLLLGTAVVMFHISFCHCAMLKNTSNGTEHNGIFSPNHTFSNFGHQWCQPLCIVPPIRITQYRLDPPSDTTEPFSKYEIS